MMEILITGGTGFIGRALIPRLQGKGHRVTILTRRPDKINEPNIRALGNPEEIGENDRIDAVINLAGAPIVKRWTNAYKRTLIDSRVGTTEKIITLMARLRRKPAVLISASAIGYYGVHDATPLDETAQPHPEFTHTLCARWETAALRAQNENVRTCIARLGVVLGNNGGALKRMLPAFRLNLGGRLGDGRQMFSWIHIDDVVSAFDFLLRDDRLSGAFNLTAPSPVTNEELTEALGRALHRATWIPMPRLAVKSLFGEMGETLLLKGQNVIPQRLRQAGFEFSYPTLDKALHALLAR